MSYQVLARKWRPDSFDSLVGQTHVVRALTNALDQQRLHHAYLFTGTRGVGKTTFGRILAKCLNCEEGISSKPCNKCRSCLEISAGRFMDLIEVDAASRTKVEDTRDLLENVSYAPTSGRFKVYLIDEVHMLSTHSFNALLKPLEEPPAHVKFFLATTDPQKLPITVLSRCLQFHLKCLSQEQITQQLATILQNENIAFEMEALGRLAYAAEGSMRDGLSLLDQAISFSSGEITTADVKAMLSTIEASYIYQIIEALINKDANALINITLHLAEHSVDFNHALEELITLLHQIALTQFVSDVDVGAWDKNKISSFANTLPQEQVQLLYQIAIAGRRDLPLAPTPRIGMEMTLLRMLAFQPVSVSASSTMPPVAALPVSKTNSASATSSSSPTGQQTQWSEIISQLGLSGMTEVIVNHCVLEKMTDDEIILAIEPGQSILLNKKQEDRIKEALQNYLQRSIQLTINKGQTNLATPAAKIIEEKNQRKSEARESITQDPHVNEIINTFNAKIISDSIEATE